MSKSRQLREPIDEKSSGLPEGYNYCRKCQRVRPNDNFGKAVDPDLDSGGNLSVCKDCTNLLYEKALSVENGSIQKAVLTLCRKLNIRYDDRAINSAILHIQSKGSDPLKLFNLFRAKLLVVLRENVNDTLVDLTYQHNDGAVIKKEENILSDDAFEEAKDLKKFWRIEDKDELEFLENEFSNFKKTHKADTHAEIILLKEICYKLLDMDKDRNLEDDDGDIFSDKADGVEDDKPEQLSE